MCSPHPHLEGLWCLCLAAQHSNPDTWEWGTEAKGKNNAGKGGRVWEVSYRISQNSLYLSSFLEAWAGIFSHSILKAESLLGLVLSLAQAQGKTGRV